jgi:hypothetical protein
VSLSMSVAYDDSSSLFFLLTFSIRVL